MTGQRIGYVRVGPFENAERQLHDIPVDRLFTDQASGKDTKRPQLETMLTVVREGDTVVVQSMDRLARNLDDLRRFVQQLTRRAIRIEFVKEELTFTGEDSPRAHLMLSVMSAFAEFERSLLRERQREGIALARQRGAYRGRKRSLTADQITDLKRRIAAGERKAHVARAFGISRETVYQYLRAPAQPPTAPQPTPANDDLLSTCLIFDIDGTLIDSVGFEDTLYKAAVRGVLGNVTLRATWSQYNHITAAGLLREICHDNELSIVEVEPRVRTRFAELVSAHLQTAGACQAMSGAITFWNSARADKRFEIGIATGGWGHTARMKLDSAGFSYEGVPLACADLSHERTQIMEQCRALLQPTRVTVYFGDDERDLAAAIALGWRFVGVGNRLKGKCPEWISDFSSPNLLDRFLSAMK